MNFYEIIPPILAIGGIVLMKKIFPDGRVKEIVDQFRPIICEEAHQDNLESEIRALAEGWQVTVDLIYNLLAILAAALCRVASGEGLIQGWIFAILLLLAGIGTVILLAIRIKRGPVDSEGVPISWLSDPKWTWGYVSFRFIIISNTLLVLAVPVEVILRSVFNWPPGHS